MKYKVFGKVLKDVCIGNIIRTIKEEYSFIKEVDITKELKVGDAIILNAKSCHVEYISFDIDEDCYDIFTNYVVEHIEYNSGKESDMDKILKLNKKAEKFIDRFWGRK